MTCGAQGIGKASETAVTEILNVVADKLGGIYALVNNAGIAGADKPTNYIAVGIADLASDTPSF